MRRSLRRTAAGGLRVSGGAGRAEDRRRVSGVHGTPSRNGVSALPRAHSVDGRGATRTRRAAGEPERRLRRPPRDEPHRGHASDRCNRVLLPDGPRGPALAHRAGWSELDRRDWRTRGRLSNGPVDEGGIADSAPDDQRRIVLASEHGRSDALLPRCGSRRSASLRTLSGRRHRLRDPRLRERRMDSARARAPVPRGAGGLGGALAVRAEGLPRLPPLARVLRVPVAATLRQAPWPRSGGTPVRGHGDRVARRPRPPRCVARVDHRRRRGSSLLHAGGQSFPEASRSHSFRAIAITNTTWFRIGRSRRTSKYTRYRR